MDFCILALNFLGEYLSVWYNPPMLHLDTPTKELFEIAALLVFLLLMWFRIGPISRGAGVWCIIGLSVDVFVWHCIRPHYVQEMFNSCNVVLGLVVIYENLKTYLVSILVFLLSLFR
jgi:hypothetical protein